MDSNVSDRINSYMDDLEAKYEEIIPVESRNKWCLVFGYKLLYTAESLDEALQKQKDCPIFVVILGPRV